MRTIVHIVLAGVLAGLSLGRPVQAQEYDAFLQAKALTQYVHDVWQAEDGLPQNTVSSIAQTKDGYLWLGTEEGLVRYDGVRFAIFDKNNTPAFEASHAIQSLLADTSNTLWIGTRGGGLVRHAGGEFTQVALHEEGAGTTVAALTLDREGTLWIGTIDAGLFALRKGRVEQYTAKDGLVSDHVNAIYQDSRGFLWIGTSAGLSRRIGVAFKTYQPGDTADAQFVFALQEHPNGTLWIGTRGGLYTLSTRSEMISKYDGATEWTDRPIRTLQVDSTGTLWVGMHGGLARLDTDRNDLFTTADGLSHDRVLALYSDREGSLWIGTEGGGLNRLWDSAFTAYTQQEHLSNDMVLTVYEDQEGAVWMGTQGGGLNRLHNGTITTYTTRDGLASNEVTSVYGAPDGTLWVGTIGHPDGGGLHRFEDGAFTRLTVQDGLPNDQVYVVFAASDGSLWLGTEAGLTHYAEGTFTTYGVQDGLGSNYVTAIHESPDGTLWVGTFDAGLARFRDGRFTHFTQDDGLGKNIILSLHEDADGTLWIGTYEGGLSRLEGETLTTYTTRNGLFNDTIYAILEDEYGHLWMSCNKGLFSVSKADLEAFDTGRLPRLKSLIYGRGDGLKNSEFNGGSQPAAWRGQTGHFWFASVEGAVAFHPSELLALLPPPNVLIETVRVDNKEVGRLADLELRPGRQAIEFSYTAPRFVATKQLEFRYILDGFRGDWQEGGASRTATYTNLDPGHYTFRVMARHGGGGWREAAAPVPLFIRPYFWQTRWFWLLCIGGLAVLGYTAYRMRIRHLKRREQELQHLVDLRTEDLRTANEQIEAQADRLRELDRFKTRFFANVSHEFRTPLTMIVGPLENALQGAYGPLAAPLNRQVEIMLRNALRLMRLINQLLDLSKLEAGKMMLRAHPRNVISFLEGVVFSFTAFAEQKGLDLYFHSDVPEIEMFFEPDKLEKVFFNLLSNAIKFTPRGGSIHIAVAQVPPSADRPDGTLEIRVRDSGVGIPEKDLPRIFDRFHQVDNSSTREHEGTGIGLALVNELILLHHGTIEVESEVGHGTTFTINLPLGRSHLNQEEVSTATNQDEAFEPEAGAMAELAFSALGFMPQSTNGGTNGHAEKAIEREAPRVLVVEDNADVREYVASILEADYQVETAGDGREGLERARTLRPDLILSDVMMPHMDGHELVAALKADEHLCQIPIVLLTARATQKMKVEGIEAGADDYLEKPFNARELQARVKNLLIIRKQAHDLRRLNETLEKKVQEQVNTLLHERGQYEQQLLTAKEQAEASSRLKSTILDNMNHEFRTPLTAIQGYAQLLAHEVPDALREFTDYIDLNGARLMKTLDAVHQLSRLEAENFQLTPEPVDLVQAAYWACDRFAERAAARDLALRVAACTEAPVQAILDSEAVARILDHLLDNAIKFTESGEVVIEVAQDARHVRLAVRDTGIGIDPVFLPHLFEAFMQGSTGLTRSYDGIGLGLAVTHRLVELLNGTIDVSTEPNRGTTFTIAFPKAPQPAARAPKKIFQTG